MCGDAVDQIGLMVSSIFHCEFSSFLDLAMGGVGFMDLGVRISSQFPVLYNIFDLVGYCVNRDLWVILH